MTSDLFDRIADAHRGIRPQVPVSPLERSQVLSTMLGCDVWLKCEHLLPIGAFKIRGATNKLRTLGAAARGGVITASTGNHGMASARAGRLAGVPVTVYLPKAAPQQKQDAIRAYGAELVLLDGDPLSVELEARRQSEIQGKPYVAPYNDLDVMAGQGTLGMELFEQAPDLDAVFVTVGGGLIGGVGTAVKRLMPAARVVGCWPKAATCMLESIRIGHIVTVPEFETLSEASAGAVEPGSVTFPVCRAVIDEMQVVEENEIAAAMRALAASDHWMVEGTAGVALAALMRMADTWRGKKVAVVLCGRNIALETFRQAIG